MCVMVYLRSNKKLPIIKWDDKVPDFYVDELNENDLAYTELKSFMAKKNLYNVGAHTGCGCGFN